MSEAEAWEWVSEQHDAGVPYPILWPSRLPPSQPVAFKSNHLRVIGPNGKVGRSSPVVHNDAEIQALVDDVARRRRLDPVSLRGRMAVTVNHRLLLRPLVDGLLEGPVVDPRSGRPLRSPMVVLGQVQELPMVAETSQGGEGPDRPTARARRPRCASSQRAPAQNPSWVNDVHAFVQSGGVAQACDPVAPPTVAALLRLGAVEARLPPLAHLPAAQAEHVFAGWARAAALGEHGRARELEAELQRRVATQAKEYNQQVVQLKRDLPRLYT